MRSSLIHISIILCLIATLSTVVSAQALATESVKWEKVRSDDGRFRVELPVTLRHFYDTDGFLIGFNSNEFQIRDSRIINAFVDGTLVSVESYRGPKSALSVIYDREKQSRRMQTKSSVRRGDVEVRQLACKSDSFSCIRWYFAIEDHIYILTTGSRTSDSVAAKRFLESVEIRPKGSQNEDSDIPMSELIRHNVMLESLSDEAADALTDALKKAGEPAKEPDVKPLTVIHSPGPYFTNSARGGMAQGSIQFIVGFSATGMIDRIQVVRSMQHGLTRQAIFAALRTKYLPTIKRDKPESTTRPMSFSFEVR